MTAVVHILLTNDDGIFAPGLAALGRALSDLGEVSLVAPITEQSGVGHSITYLTPLIVQEIFDGETFRGWAVDGSPADCVKLAVTELCPRRPDLVVSGINSGLNAGINVLYSGTVAAAIEGAFFGINSIAVSLEYDEHARYDRAAEIAVKVIRQLLEHQDAEPELYNLNIPESALDGEPELRVVPMDVVRRGEGYERRRDPRGRDYFWAANLPEFQATGPETDLTALLEGCVTLTALDYNMTDAARLETMRSWQMRL